MLNDVVFEVDRWLISSEFDWDYFFDDAGLFFESEFCSVFVCVRSSGLVCKVYDDSGVLESIVMFVGSGAVWQCGVFVGSILYHFS